MSFIAGMPESGSTTGNTRQKLVNELAGMRSTMATNHKDQNDSGAGKHTFCQFTSVSPSTTAATELALYNKNVAGNQRLYIRQPSNGTEIQISGIDPLADKNGYVFLPGGLLLQWGQATLIKNVATRPVTFPKGSADGFVLLRVIGLTLASPDFSIGFSSPSNDGFIAALDSVQKENIPFGYMVIGTIP